MNTLSFDNYATVELSFEEITDIEGGSAYSVGKTVGQILLVCLLIAAI